MHRFLPRALLGGLLIAAMLVVAGCGSSSSSSAGVTIAGGTAQKITNTAKATGAPITVMTIDHADATSNVFPEYGYVAQTYEKWVNAHGGIKDASGVSHDLKVILCEDQNDPNQDAACGREAVAKKVTAVVGAETLNDNNIIPILASKKIAFFGDCCGFLKITETSSDAFDTGSSNDLGTAIGAVAGKECKSTTFVTLQSPYAASSEEAVTEGLKSQGAAAPSSVALPATATDYSGQVAQILEKHAQCLAVIGLNQANWFAFLPAYKQAGGKAKIVTDNASLSGVPTKFPSELQGAITVGLYPALSDPAFTDYRNAVATYESGVKADWGGIAGEATWTAYVEFANVIKTMSGPLTAASFLAAANKQTALSSDGLTPTLNFTKAPTQGYPRLFNQSVTLFKVNQGQIVRLPGGKFYDMSKAFAGERQPLSLN